MTKRQRLPRWMKMQFPKGATYSRVKNIVQDNKLHTICTAGTCPNIGECWGCATAAFMILGDICTRGCTFCGVKTGKPLDPDADEPKRLAESIKKMQLKHAVITSVDRDDLEDYGSGFWATVIREVKRVNPTITLEVLIPDFNGDKEALQKVIDEKPEVISHNLETVKRLTPQIRSKAAYDKSLQVLQWIHEAGIVAKSGIMLGLGERQDEILETMDDLRQKGCQVMTIGQYLQPSEQNIEVKEFIHPDVFEFYKEKALEKGFDFVESAPLVRSSYRADRHASLTE